MKTMIRLATGVLVAGMLSAPSASAQFSVVDESSETKWGATAYAGGDVDTLGNYQLGLRVNYRLIQVKPLLRLQPEVGVQFRKNYWALQLGARGDTRELLRFSLFGGAGIMGMVDFTNVSGVGDNPTASTSSWYAYAGAKFRLPSFSGVPILKGLPLEDTAIFLAEEFTDLEQPEPQGAQEFHVDEWYPYSIQLGIMVGSASGWFQ